MPIHHDDADGFQQDCSRCRLIHSCWSARHTDWEVQAHLLVCRVKTGDERAKADLTDHIMDDVKAAVAKVGQAHDLGGLGYDIEDVEQEALIKCLQYLEHDHLLGDRWVIWNRLFDRLGLVQSYVRNMHRSLRRADVNPLYLDDLTDDDGDFDVGGPEERPDDGLMEEQILELCQLLTPAERASIVEVMMGGDNEREDRVSRLSGARKIITLLGDQDIVGSRGNPARRLAWASGAPCWGLTTREVGDIMVALDEGATFAELGWAFGVSVATISRLKNNRPHDRARVSR